MFLVLIPLSLLMLVIEMMRMECKPCNRLFRKLFGPVLRQQEEVSFTGATYLLISSVVCIGLFPAEIAFVCLAFLAVGDTFAAVIGVSFGKRKLAGGRKSVEGSLACFVVTFLFALFWLYPLVALTGAILATLAEMSGLPLDDNLKIPIVSGLGMSLINIFV
ncbi:MAG: phosphatidate cytidylyltransferase [Candidatus Cloacimonetes bacterium]|nr:phosphatidate cytidylyltransferase [Candidatus Cloacimonadota bacterium]